MTVVGAVVGRESERRLAAVLRASQRRGDAAPTLLRAGSTTIGIRLGPTSGSIHVGERHAIVVDGWIDEIDGRPTGPWRDHAALLADRLDQGQLHVLRRLRGEYVVVVLDRRSRSLHLIRDRAGVKPCFYAERNAELVVGSQVAMVRTDRLVGGEPNLGVIAHHLAATSASVKGTLWRDVERFPAASIGTWDRHRLRVRRSWQSTPADGDRRWCGSSPTVAAEVIEEVRHRTRRAIERRLRPEITAIELSGGLDSSSIVGTAATEIVRSPRDIVTASLRMPAGGSGDEWSHIESVVSHHGVRSMSAPPTQASREDLLAATRRHQYLAPSANGYMWHGLADVLASDGRLLTLSGTGGDEWFQRSALWPAESLLRAGPRPFAQLSRAALRHGPVAWLGEFVAPVLRECSWRHRRVPPWVNADFAASVDLADRLHDPLSGCASGFSRADRARLARLAVGAGSFEGQDRVLGEHGVESRFPFWDDDLVDLMVVVPERLRWEGSHDRSFQAAVFADRLPPSVAARTDKAHFGDLAISMIGRLGGWRALENGPTMRSGWLDEEVFAALYRRLLDSHARCGAMPGLRVVSSVFAIDLWLMVVSGERSV